MSTNAPTRDLIADTAKQYSAFIPQYVQEERAYKAPSWTKFRVEHTIHRYSDGTATCSCTGFGFTGHCRHLELLEYAIQRRKVRDVLEIKADQYTDAAIEARVPGFLRAPRIDVATGAVVS